MSTATASAAPSVLPIAGGQCGHQHSMAPCLPMEGFSCCSVDGFCGSNATYCLVSNGCQYGCVEPSVFGITTTATSTTAIRSSTSSADSTRSTFISSTLSSVTAKPSATASAHHSGLTGKSRTGVIVGATVGGVILLLLIAFIINRIIIWRRESRRSRDGYHAPMVTGPGPDNRVYNMELSTTDHFRLHNTGD